MLPAPVTPDLAAPEVTDFLHDAVAGLLQPVLTDNPFDILSVDYGCSFDSLTSNVRVTATMKVSSLVPVPAGGLWRISFAANAAGGVSDNGDQFYLLAGTTGAAPTFTYGTAVRGGDGNMVYTSRGSADAGRIDSLAGTITMSVSLSKLNLYVTAGPPIGPGSVLQGLRARASSNGANAVTDLTRGGTSYRLTCGLPTGIDAPPARALGSSSVDVTSLNPSHGKTTIRFRLPRAGHAELSVFDMQGRRVRTLESRTLPAGTFERVWDGRTDHFTDAAPGVYILALSADDGVRTQRIALLR